MDTTRSLRRSAYWEAKSADEKNLEKLVLDILREHSASGWTVIFGRQTTAMGYCNYRTREICISRRVLLNGWEHALDTALHEIAHALTADEKASHGPRWRAMARKLGAKPLAKAEFLFEDKKGELKTVKTNYGPVQVRIGDEVDVFGGIGKLRITDVRRTKFTGKSAMGSVYLISVDLLHPNYGTDRVPRKVVTLLDRQKNPFEIILGETIFHYKGIDYTAVWISGKTVRCISAQGKFLRVDQTLFADRENS